MDKKIKNKYSIKAKIKIVLWLFRTKLICKRAKLIRFPIDIRGRKFINFGNNLTTGKYCRLEAFSFDGQITMCFGNKVQINDNVHISAMKNVNIGNNVLMAGNIYISDNSHGSYIGNDNDSSPNIEPIKREYFIDDVNIEDNVWIGEGVIILPGITIGKGAIIGANSVVNKDIPEYTIAVGNPVCIKKRYNFKIKKWEKFQ